MHDAKFEGARILGQTVTGGIMPITFDDRLVLNGKLQVRVKFHEMIDDHYYSADVDVWVPETDSWETTKATAIEEANSFLKLLVSKPK